MTEETIETPNATPVVPPVKEVETQPAESKKVAEKPQDKSNGKSAHNKSAKSLVCPHHKEGDYFTFPVEDILVDKGANPRRVFDKENLASMAATIKQVGLIHPLSLYWGADSKYHLIAGERRLRAAKLAGIKSVPVQLCSNNAGDVAYIRMTENLHHERLNPLEEAYGLRELLGKSIYLKNDNKPTIMTAKILAREYKKSEAWISQRLALLDLPSDVQDALLKGTITFIHARELIDLKSPEAQRKYFEKITKEGLKARGELQQAVDKAKGDRARVKNKGKDEVLTGKPDIGRQSLDTALKNLQSAPIAGRKRDELRESLATSYEKFDRSKDGEKRQFYKGVVAGLEWAAGLRDKF